MIRFYNLQMVFFAFVLTSTSCNNSNITVKGAELEIQLILNEEFEDHMSNWTVEQREGGSVKVENGKMDIDDASGCTVWFNKKLSGNIMIEYEAVVIDEGGTNDRVSDLNCFWMATDISTEDFFATSEQRGGKFQNYHDMKLYYVGLGGHNNTKTRFRRYAGGGERPCLPGHDLSDAAFLITANAINHIRIVVYNKHIQYYRNGLLIYDFEDQDPYSEGYFGIRTFKNHMTVDNFKVYSLHEN
ncbi:DUF6250 domain-containing protein [Carboxylicivirga sp. RSCT41]|uniref:DUF6250 domain-containing protein n=1 Tax=Carboxylicivirga agarovorans TaxID=3417570 RepID=UPI003D35975B